MEQRQHPRITLPLLVEVHHPSIGHRRAIARDVSEGGVFVMLEGAPFREGSKVRLTLLNPSTVEQQATPTVDMHVVRVEDAGFALSFASRTSAHLWNSVEQLRKELEIGRDYFQVHQSALVLDGKQRLLIVQQQGRWRLPGHYLQVGEAWQEALSSWLEATFNLRKVEFTGTVEVSNALDPALPEAATLKLFHQFTADSSGFSNPADIKESRWIDRLRTLEEFTFVHEEQRRVALKVFRDVAPKEDAGN